MASWLRRLSFCRFYSKFDLRPNRRSAPGALGEAYCDDTNRYFSQHRGGADFACRGCTLVSDVWLSAYEDQNAGNKRENAKDDDRDGKRECRGNSVNNEEDRQHEHAKIFSDNHAESLACWRSHVTPK